MTADYEGLWSDSGRWGDMQDIGPVHRHMGRLILGVAKAIHPTSILDVGCGNGSSLSKLQSSLGLMDVCGIDISEAAIEIARQRVKGEFLVRNIELKTPSRTCDLVISNQVIEHIDDDEAFLAKIRSMSGRYCLIGTMQGRMRASEVHIGHLRNYTTPELHDKMQAGRV